MIYELCGPTDGVLELHSNMEASSHKYRIDGQVKLFFPLYA